MVAVRARMLAQDPPPRGDECGPAASGVRDKKQGPEEPRLAAARGGEGGARRARGSGGARGSKQGAGGWRAAPGRRAMGGRAGRAGNELASMAGERRAAHESCAGMPNTMRVPVGGATTQLHRATRSGDDNKGGLKKVKSVRTTEIRKIMIPLGECLSKPSRPTARHHRPAQEFLGRPPPLGRTKNARILTRKTREFLHEFCADFSVIMCFSTDLGLCPPPPRPPLCEKRIRTRNRLRKRLFSPLV